MANHITPQIGESASGPAPLPARLPRRILVVEDDDDMRRQNVATLKQAGYLVDGAEDGAFAWEALGAATYDLVVTDNNMPKVTGVELIGKMQTAHMTLPVIMASWAMPEEQFARSRSLRPAATLLKPYAFSELVAAVREVLGREAGRISQLETPPIADVTA